MAAKTIKTTNFKIQTSDNIQNSNFKQRPFDLEERMAKFGIVTQLVRSATSVGANYAEANNGSSRRDFRNKVHKEAHELTLILQTIINKLDLKVGV